MQWLNEYSQHNKLTYLKQDQGSRDHLKITLYPYDFCGELKNIYLSPRLNFRDLLQIIPKKSIRKLSPERRLDASVLFTLASKELRG
ncbi:MAG: hypothetical protein CMI54_07820 [Parcubacteria group bacterium]|nr:hypothetical protein [Parcubacteria group bacterium]